MSETEKDPSSRSKVSFQIGQKFYILCFPCVINTRIGQCHILVRVLKIELVGKPIHEFIRLICLTV